MLVQDGGTTGIIEGCAIDEDVTEVKTCSETAVEDEQQGCSQQYRERKYTKDGCDEEGPDSQRKLRHRHTLCTKVKHRTDVVNTSQ